MYQTIVTVVMAAEDTCWHTFIYYRNIAAFQKQIMLRRVPVVAGIQTLIFPASKIDEDKCFKLSPVVVIIA